MAEMTIYAELFRAAKTAPDGFPDRNMASEKVTEFLTRLVRVIGNKIPDAAWDALSEKAQAWHTEASRIVNEGGEVTEVQGYDHADGASDSAEKEEPAKPAKAPAKKAAAKKAEEKPVKVVEKPAKTATKKEATKKEEKPAKAEKPAKEAPTSKAVKDKKAAVVPIKKEQKPSMMHDIREIMIVHSNYNTNDLRAALVKLGWDNEKIKQNILSVSCGDAKNLIKRARELGYWNDK